MTRQSDHNVTIEGDGPITLLFAHGFGCDQNTWRLMAPHYAANFRTVRYDLAGSGSTDPALYDRTRHATLHGHAQDMVELVAEIGGGPVVVVGHSVSAMIGLLAGVAAPKLFRAHVMVGPSPCYINEGDYVGGFSREDIDSLLETLESNYLGWSTTMAPAIMGAPGQPELGGELTNSFCRADPEVAAHFARVTFLSDHRADLPRLAAPTLILQCSDDFIAPRPVGEYMQAVLPDAEMVVIDNIGHCPHLSAPCACIDAIDGFLARLGDRSGTPAA